MLQAYNTISLIAALLLSTGLTVFAIPAGALDDWEEWQGTKTCVRVSSGWCMLFCLMVILYSWAILSLTNRVPRKDFREFVLNKWMFFASPILMLNIAIFMLLCCFAALAYRIYGKGWAAFGFSWAFVWLAWLGLNMALFMNELNKLDAPEHHEEHKMRLSKAATKEDGTRVVNPLAAA